jgi:hypothetical protein
MPFRWLRFGSDDIPDAKEWRLYTTVGSDVVLERLRQGSGERLAWVSMNKIFAEMNDQGFRLRVGMWGAVRNPHRPILVGHLTSLPGGTEVRMHFERPHAWVGTALAIGAATILPIVFIAGVIGMLVGARTDQGGSLLPFVVGPIGMASFFYIFGAALRYQARSQEERLTAFVDTLVA